MKVKARVRFVMFYLLDLLPSSTELRSILLSRNAPPRT
jgi:hypothetical protein